MKAEEFAKRIMNDPEDNIFPKGTDAQSALYMLADHFLGMKSCIIDYPASGDQWNSEVVLAILRKYPQGSIRIIPRRP